MPSLEKTKPSKPQSSDHAGAWLLLILILADIGCAIAAGVTGDLGLKQTSAALKNIVGVLTPILVFGVLFGWFTD